MLYPFGPPFLHLGTPPTQTPLIQCPSPWLGEKNQAIRHVHLQGVLPSFSFLTSSRFTQPAHMGSCHSFPLHHQCSFLPPRPGCFSSSLFFCFLKTLLCLTCPDPKTKLKLSKHNLIFLIKNSSQLSREKIWEAKYKHTQREPIIIIANNSLSVYYVKLLALKESFLFPYNK